MLSVLFLYSWMGEAPPRTSWPTPKPARKQAEEAYDAASDQFDTAEPARDAAWEQRAQARQGRYAVARLITGEHHGCLLAAAAAVYWIQLRASRSRRRDPLFRSYSQSDRDGA